jgi:Ca2+-binding EF-hand superfamily protein
MNVGSLLSESASHRLKRLFNKLDTDKDGYIYEKKILSYEHYLVSLDI